jgi:hypothetical protein
VPFLLTPLSLSKVEFCAALSFRLHLPLGFLQRGGCERDPMPNALSCDVDQYF